MRKLGRYHRISHVFTLFVLLNAVQIIICSDFCYSKVTPIKKNNNEFGVRSFSLSDVIKKGLTSIQFDPPLYRKELKQFAHFYVKMRRKGITQKEKNRFTVDCLKNEERNPFCTLAKDANQKENDDFSRKTKAKLPSDLTNSQQILSWISNADLEKLQKVPDVQFKNVLKTISSFSVIEKLAEALDTSDCSGSNLSLFLAVKAEEFFPDKNVKNKTLRLYEKTAKCEEGENAIIAHYRTSLLNLWDDHCENALPHLDYLVEHANENDYLSRALYWQYQCRKKSGDQAGEAKTKDRLLQQHPFSFHALLANNEVKRAPRTLQADSEVKFQVEGNPRANARIKAVEALLDIREEKLAREAAATLDQILEREDSSVRLYEVVLYNRMNVYGKNFKLLTAIFRDDPSSISTAALELYYPKKIENINELARSGIDNMLLLSLIRQESAFNAKAKSSAGALGLMQVMPMTARRYGRMRKADKLLDPRFNLKIGSKYFSSLLTRFNGDAALAIAAYNAGEKRIDQWVARYPVKDRVLFLDLIPFKETRKYVSSIARNYFWYVTLYSNKVIKDQTIESTGILSLRSLERTFHLAGT